VYSKGVVVWLMGGRMHVMEDGEQTPRFTLRAKDELGVPLVVGDEVFIGAGREALQLSLTKCRSDGPVGPAELTGEGCIVARLELPEVAYARPVRLGEVVYFLADGRVHQMKGGKKGWAAELEGDELIGVERNGKRLLLAASRWTMDHPARLVALDPDSGETLMQVDLPGSEMTIYDVRLARDGDAVLAATSKRLYRWDLSVLEAVAGR
jgi:hypothetical protein